jgi:tryptophan synthase beta subunit
VGQSIGEPPLRRAEAYGDQQIPRAENLPGLGNQRTMKRAPKMRKTELIIVNLSGRGDKDVAQVAAKVKLEMPK